MNAAETFLNIARKDLKAANCLYENKLYPQAVFFLQQSIEKMSKSLSASLDMFTMDELKTKIGHDATKIYRCMMENFLEDIKSKDLWHQKDFIYSGQIGITKCLNIIKETSKILGDKQKIESIPKKELINLIPDLITKRKRFNIIIEVIDKYKKELFDIWTISDIPKEFNEIIKNNDFKKSHQTLKILFEILYLDLTLIVLSIIVSPSCVENTRYPDTDSNPLQIYTHRNPIVKSFHELVKLCRSALRGLNKVYKEFERMETKDAV